MNALSAELYWLTLTALWTSVLWAPHILQRIIEMKPHAAFRDPGHDLPTQAPWAQRAIRAHTNAVENLSVFATLVLVLEISGLATATTASAAMVYFVARVVHYIVYTLGIPWLRTPIYLISWGCMMMIGAVILGG